MDKISNKLVWVMWGVFLISPLFDILRFQIMISGRHWWVFTTLGSLAGKSFELILVCCTSVAVWWLYRAYQNHSRSKATAAGELFISLSGGLAFVMSNYLTHLENNNYHNFLYSNYGLRTERLSIYGLVGLVVALIAFVTLVVKKSNINEKGVQNVVGILGYIGLAVLLASSCYTVINFFTFINLAKLDYKDKFGPEYSYIEFLKENTKESETIILPKQSSEWPVLGNQPVTRYFLYPRLLYSSGVLTNTNKPNLAIFLWIKRREDEWPIIFYEKKCIVFYSKVNNCINYNSLELLKTGDDIKLYKITFL